MSRAVAHHDRADAGETGFRYTRKVLFYETDLAGVVHFSNYFRYMEEAEHALWRAAGLSIGAAGQEIGWPRVSATFDYRSPLFFEDEFAIRVRVQAVTKRTIQYAFALTRDATAIGSGSLTAACVTQQAALMRSVEVPPDVVSRLRAAAGQTV
jgi:YbgC/YbaW family acyl-CoA thioester hydrolase